MEKILIDRYKIVPCPITGIGWVQILEWVEEISDYKRLAVFRTVDEAERFLNK